jgi:hypothetical protein
MGGMNSKFADKDIETLSDAVASNSVCCEASSSCNALVLSVRLSVPFILSLLMCVRRMILIEIRTN